MEQRLIPEIAEAVAESQGVESEDLEVVLADHINLDAVNTLAQHSTSTWTLTFELPEHTVTVANDGGIFVDGQLEENWVTARNMQAQ